MWIITSVRKLIVLFILVGALFLFSACARGGQTTFNYPATNVSSVSSPTPESQPVNVVLRRSSLGTMTLIWHPRTRALLVQSEFYNLAPKGTYAVSIYYGDCQHSGRMLYHLPNIVAGTNGSAFATARIVGIPGGIPEHGWYINIQHLPRPENDALAVSPGCANIVRDQNITTWQPQNVLVRFSNFSTSGQNNNDGKVQLNLQNGQLLVKATLKNLTPDSTHMGYIFSGSCSSKQRQILYELNPITATPSGSGSSVTQIPNVYSIPAKGWSINYVMDPETATLTGQEASSCG
ncbi:MAG: hypothetical protein J2P36_10345, partial [Ktedonobacteraceae bacterium]|nr:hypothetical protein [Ktedonobacteraceae bacterium]